jgi:hypothetical protein
MRKYRVVVEYRSISVTLLKQKTMVKQEKNTYLVRATENGLDQKTILIILPKMVGLFLLRSLYQTPVVVNGARRTNSKMTTAILGVVSV